MYTVSFIILSSLLVQKGNGISSPLQPYTNYKYSLELQPQVAHLWWTADGTQQEIPTIQYVNSLEEQSRKQRAAITTLERKLTRCETAIEQLRSVISRS